MRILFTFLFSISLFAQHSLYQLVSFQVPSSTGIYEVFRSEDLTNWNAQTISYDCLTSPGPNGVRDPSITLYNGTYYLIHTNTCTSPYSGWIISWSQSSNGLVWSNHTQLDLTQMGIPAATTSWAPEWFIDPNASGLSSVHAFLTVSTTGSSPGAFQVYEIHPTASDFSTWSNAELVTVTGVSSLIDVFPIYKSGTYYLWYKLQDGSCNIQYASSSTLLGTYTNVKTGNWAGFTNQGCVEGPALIQTSTGYRLFLDLDFNSLSEGQINYSDSTGSSWASWTAITPISTPSQAKHGTAISLGINPASMMRGRSTIRGQAVIR